jgi:type IV pilus assembly protein PilW
MSTLYRKPVSFTTSQAFTLVELMVGLAVSLFITLIIQTIYTNTKNVSSIEDSLSRLQENGRFAIEMMESDIRMAGFLGCRGQSMSPLNVLNGSAYQYQYAQGIYGFYGAGGSWSPALDSSISSFSPLINTDVMTVWSTDQAGLPLIQALSSSTDNPNVGANTVFNNGDIALITDCNARAVFEVTETNPQTTGILSHAVTTTPSPGNAANNFQHIYGLDASVYRVTARTYYIAPSLRKPGSNSLWRYCVPKCVGTTQNDELSEGVDDLYIVYGIDTDGDGAANRYLTADSVTTGGFWPNVVSVKINLLLATLSASSTLSQMSYSFAGQTVTPTDRKLRSSMTTVIALRNRVP